VVTGDNPGRLARGSYGWNGGFGTSYVTDPEGDLTFILLTQHEFTVAWVTPYMRNSTRVRIKLWTQRRESRSAADRAVTVIGDQVIFNVRFAAKCSVCPLLG
jgi:CubicO group peptidase (beta-lactamase class C family)